MWTTENRIRYDRSKLRYPSDLTDEEWAVIGPLIPRAKRGGNKRTSRRPRRGARTACAVQRIHHALYVACREQAGRETSPTAAITDSQSVKSVEKGASIDPHGFDAGKKIKGKKRHVLVDTHGLMLHAIVHAADIQDRDGGALLVATLFGLHPFLTKLYADAGYQGPRLPRR